MKIIIIAHPNSKRARIEKDLLGTLHVYVNAPPLEGKANNAIIQALTKYFDVKKSEIILVSGKKRQNQNLPNPERLVLFIKKNNCQIQDRGKAHPNNIWNK